MSSWITEIDSLIRLGDLPAAKRRLRKINRNALERKELAQVSSLATRAGEPELAIRWLNPIVRAERKLLKPATEKERAEYGVALIRIGAQGEALEILEELSSHAKNFPQILLFRAIGYFSQWDYARALPVLEDYLKQQLTEYQRMVGLVNLSAALIFESKHEEAERVLAMAIEACRASQAALLLGNCLELSAQLALGRGDLKGAERNLKAASVELNQGAGIDSFFVRKWKAIVQLAERASSERLTELGRIRKEALKFEHWESVRDCDFYRALHTSDEKLVTHLYYGTPFPRFRARIETQLGKGKLTIPGTFDWHLGGPGTVSRILDLALAEEVRSGQRLKANQVPHRLLVALARDFYRPLSLAGLFGLMFPDDYFHPVFSVNRTHQAMLRLREWLAEGKVPLLIREERGTYRLDASAPMAIRATLKQGGGRLQIPLWKGSRGASRLKPSAQARPRVAWTRR